MKSENEHRIISKESYEELLREAAAEFREGSLDKRSRSRRLAGGRRIYSNVDAVDRGPKPVRIRKDMTLRLNS